MMKVLAVCALAFAAVVMAGTDSYAPRFVDWMHEHGKSYGQADFHNRFAVWKANMKFVEEFKGTHKVAMNAFGDLTKEEFARLHLGTVATPRVGTEGAFKADASLQVPASVDWRQKGVVTGVKNQGQCGSCWSFSTTGSTEGAHAIKTGSLVSLSEQQLVDCSGSYGNQGCNGGLMDNAFQYIIANKGIDTEACYPYQAVQGTCHFQTSCIGATLSSYKDVTSGDEQALTQAIATVGPISVAIDAGQSSFQFYQSGVYSDSGCCSSESCLDHGVLAVGYGTQSGSDYYIVKNSWGTSWGLQGYILMARNDNNMCGIATMPSYPIA